MTYILILIGYSIDETLIRTLCHAVQRLELLSIWTQRKIRLVTFTCSKILRRIVVRVITNSMIFNHTVDNVINDNTKRVAIHCFHNYTCTTFRVSYAETPPFQRVNVSEGVSNLPFTSILLCLKKLIY